jgi:hypothetical protein
MERENIPLEDERNPQSEHLEDREEQGTEKRNVLEIHLQTSVPKMADEG